MIRTAFFLLFMLLLCSCAVKKQVVEGPMIVHPGLLFVNYRVYVKKDVYSATLIDTIFKDGKLKEIVQSPPEVIPGCFLITQLDKSSKEIWKVYVPNVLTKNVEYVDERGQFQNKQIKLDSALLSERLPFDPNSVAIRLSRINKNLKPEVLLTTKFYK